MQLEQTLEMYQPMQMERPGLEERQIVYTIVDLEYLSASALYGISGPLGRSGPLKLGSSGPLTVRPFSSFQLHIYEGAGGTGHVKYPDGTKTLLNSYDAAMADLFADNLDISKYLRKDKSERKGRV